jgi:CubicO group peptidase (beta-lactamase class C family)
LFGTAEAVGDFARTILNAFGDKTLERFVRKSSVPGSSRALGWDTMLPTSSCGTRMSPRAIGHTGFTGTSLWIDPERDLYVVMLTNRVHPSRENNQIQPARRAFHDAVVSAY